MFRRAMVSVVAVALAGCSQEPVVCSTVGWSNGLGVRLADDWPAGGGRTLTVECGRSDSCLEFGDDGTVPLVDGEAVLRFGFATPDRVTLQVRDATGVLTEYQADIGWERVGGSDECGGPSEADAVVVPAP